jgi:hypothetical protein
MAEKHPTAAEMRSAELRRDKRLRIEPRAERVFLASGTGSMWQSVLESRLGMSP